MLLQTSYEGSLDIYFEFNFLSINMVLIITHYYYITGQYIGSNQRQTIKSFCTRSSLGTILSRTENDAFYISNHSNCVFCLFFFGTNKSVPSESLSIHSANSIHCLNLLQQSSVFFFLQLGDSATARKTLDLCTDTMDGQLASIFFIFI